MTSLFRRFFHATRTLFTGRFHWQHADHGFTVSGDGSYKIDPQRGNVSWIASVFRDMNGIWHAAKATSAFHAISSTATEVMAVEQNLVLIQDPTFNREMGKRFELHSDDTSSVAWINGVSNPDPKNEELVRLVASARAQLRRARSNGFQVTLLHKPRAQVGAAHNLIRLAREVEGLDGVSLERAPTVAEYGEHARPLENVLKRDIASVRYEARVAGN